ncbi:MAG TPA: DUF1080 domain-containing protein, partial [Gemmatimonadaceae bacterium]|nr:DUF1080 domain-containing protein [Gemmatimonadaceae bacterium]
SAFVAGRPPAPGAAAAAPTPATWKVENGYVEAVPRGGSIRTKESFGDVQLHAEWATPNPPMLTGQDRGNSGIILMGQYEIQVLDSYGRTDTYADGTAGSIYGQYPPLVNASRPPGEWQTYDIYFRRPRFRSDGSLQEPARATVVLNGLLVQNNEIIYGPTAPTPPYRYAAHADELPLTIQDHGQPVRFRNIWVRRLRERPEPPPGYVPNAAALTPTQMQGMAGRYWRPRPATGAPAAGPPPGQPAPAYTVTVQGSDVYVAMGGFGGNARPVRAIPTAPDRLWITGRAAELLLTRDASGVVTTVREAGSTLAPAQRGDAAP